MDTDRPSQSMSQRAIRVAETEIQSSPDMKRDHRGLVTTRTPRGSGIRRSPGSANSLDTHPVELCRYPNKRCWSTRALKDNGELHSFCEWHRNCANQYQRRLEQRRRNKKLNITTSSAATAVSPSSSELKPNMCMTGIQSVAEASSRAIADAEAAPKLAAATPSTQEPIVPAPIPIPAGGSAVSPADEYEPFRSPVPLRIEDLQYLSLCFPESGPEA